MLLLSNDVRVIDEEIQNCHRRLKFLFVEREKHFSAQPIACKRCTKSTSLMEWIFRQAYYYQTPNKYEEGNGWRVDDCQSLIVCPECATEYRLSLLPPKEQQLVLSHRHLFAQGADINDQ